MALGGFFGGSSSSSDDKSSSTTPTSTITPPIANPLSSSFSSSSGPANATLQRLQTAVIEQSNVNNAKQLISNVNTNCFEKCVLAPGGQLSASEQKCLTSCMEKYIDAWNTTSKTYTARLQRESAAMGGLGGMGGAQGGGKEMF